MASRRVLPSVVHKRRRQIGRDHVNMQAFAIATRVRSVDRNIGRGLQTGAVRLALLLAQDVATCKHQSPRRCRARSVPTIQQQCAWHRWITAKVPARYNMIRSAAAALVDVCTGA